MLTALLTAGLICSIAALLMSQDETAYKLWSALSLVILWIYFIARDWQ